VDLWLFGLCTHKSGSVWLVHAQNRWAGDKVVYVTTPIGAESWRGIFPAVPRGGSRSRRDKRLNEPRRAEEIKTWCRRKKPNESIGRFVPQVTDAAYLFAWRPSINTRDSCTAGEDGERLGASSRTRRKETHPSPYIHQARSKRTYRSGARSEQHPWRRSSVFPGQEQDRSSIHGGEAQFSQW
jgi:hypothetical protein